MKSKGINMSVEDVEARLEDKKRRHLRQVERMQKLEQTMQNTNNDIEQLEHTLREMKRAAAIAKNTERDTATETKRKRRPRIIPHDRVPAFITYATHVFDYLQHRLRRTLNYVWFCLSLCSRYLLESRTKRPGHRYLTPNTILGYFKKEKEDMVRER